MRSESSYLPTLGPPPDYNSGITEAPNGIDDFLGPTTKLSIFFALLVCCLIPILYMIFSYFTHRFKPPVQKISKKAEPDADEEEFPLPPNKFIERLENRNKKLFDGYSLKEGEMIIYRGRKGDQKNENDGQNQKDEKEDSFCLNIKETEFMAILEKMAYSPTILTNLTSEYRDPSLSLIQNWFEHCQPEFEIPDKLCRLGLENPTLNRNPAARQWDSTSLVVDKGRNNYFMNAHTLLMPGEAGEIVGTMIICQAPFDNKEKGKKETRGLFWKMVEETRSEMIVMACQNKEKGVIKCGKYFPDRVKQGEVFGDYKITLIELRELYEGELVVRRLEYYDKTAGKISPASILHYQFPKWKEGGIPSGKLPLDAIKFVTMQARRQSKPVIVHSSLGTGRACIFAGVEFLCRSLCVDPHNTPTISFQIDFRKRKMGALQTGEQLFYVQNVALDMIAKKFYSNENTGEIIKATIEKQWEYLRRYYKKDAQNQKDLEELQVADVEKFGEKVPFACPPGRKHFVAQFDPKKLKKPLADEDPRQMARNGNQRDRAILAKMIEEGRPPARMNRKAALGEIENQTNAKNATKTNDAPTKTKDTVSKDTVSKDTTVADQTKTETSTIRKPPNENGGVENLDMDAEEN